MFVRGVGCLRNLIIRRGGCRRRRSRARRCYHPPASIPVFSPVEEPCATLPSTSSCCGGRLQSSDPGLPSMPPPVWVPRSILCPRLAEVQPPEQLLCSGVWPAQCVFLVFFFARSLSFEGTAWFGPLRRGEAGTGAPRGLDDASPFAAAGSSRCPIAHARIGGAGDCQGTDVLPMIVSRPDNRAGQHLRCGRAAAGRGRGAAGSRGAVG